MCTTIEDQCPACRLTYLNHPQACTNPQPPFCTTIKPASDGFAGLTNPYNDTLRTRWCDGCILRDREYSEILDYKKKEDGKLDDGKLPGLFEQYVDRACSEEVDPTHSALFDVSWEAAKGCNWEGVYWVLKKHGVPEQVERDNRLREIEKEIRKVKDVTSVLEARMEVLVRGWEEGVVGQVKGMRTRWEWMMTCHNGGIEVDERE